MLCFRATAVFFLSCSLTLLSSACGDANWLKPEDDSEPLPLREVIEPTHLVFAAIDVLSSPWQSSVYSLDLADHSVKSLITGESGDPLILLRSNQLFLFNRTFDSLNFRQLSWDDQQELQLGTQRSLQGAQFGDPHDMLLLTDKTFLMANYTAGTLTIVNQLGEIQRTIADEWDLPEGTKLKPESFAEAETAGGERLIFVIHQALVFKGGQMQVDGSQTAFVLRRLGELDVEVVDTNPDLPKIQGIKLAGSLPQQVPVKIQGKNVLVSMCQQYLFTTPSSQSCQSAIETLDADALTAEVIWDLNSEGLLMNGPVFGGYNQKVLANVQLRAEDGSTTKHVVELNLTTKTWQKVVDFPAASGGFWGGFQNPHDGTLYIGDTDASGQKGRMIIVKGDDRREIELERTPYSGAFVDLD
jgi:hypothetical protein